jgi:hypothetical protein
MKPVVNINQMSVSLACNQQKTITVSVSIFVKGVYRICLDIPSEMPVFFADTNSNSISTLGDNPLDSSKKDHDFQIRFLSHSRDKYAFMLKATITDSIGNSMSDYCKINLDCL